MFTKLERFITGGAVVTVAALVLAGCSSGHATPSSAEATAPKMTTLTVQAPYYSAAAPADGNAIADKLSSMIGMNLDVNWIPNASYVDKTNITLASNNVPDVLVEQTKDASFVKNAEAGAFWDLTDILKDYPNLTTSNPQVQKASSINGKIYGIYRPRDPMRVSISIRKDWLDKLGLSMPKTTDDLYKIAKAFTEDDPDGDGKKDTYGLIVPKWPGSIGTNSPWDVIESWFGAGNLWTESGGKLEPSFMTKQWKQALAYEKKFISNGYINPDYATMDSTDWEKPFLNGQGGILIDTYSTTFQMNSLLEKSDPTNYQKYLTFTGNLLGPDGKMHALPTAGYSGYLVIPKTSVKTEAQLRQVLTALNKLNSTKGQILMNNGIEGKNFTVVDGHAQAIVSTEATELTNDAAGYAQFSTPVAGNKFYVAKMANDYDQKMYDKRVALEASDLKKAVFNAGAAYVSKTYVLDGVTLDNIISDARIKYDAGQIDDAGLSAALQQWKTSGGTQVIAEMNKLYKADKNK